MDIFGWCTSIQNGDVQKSTLKVESTSRVRMFQTWTHDRPWFRQENIDNKMCCMHYFGIANNNHVKRPSSNTCFIFGSTVLRLENIEVCHWVMCRICKGLGKSMFFMFQLFVCVEG